MANMSYCRYENTLNDLKDCFRAMQNESEDHELSKSEKRCKDQLIALCQQIIEFNDCYFEDDEDDFENE